jgi:hypothetical protein
MPPETEIVSEFLIFYAMQSDGFSVTETTVFRFGTPSDFVFHGRFSGIRDGSLATGHPRFVAAGGVAASSRYATFIATCFSATGRGESGPLLGGMSLDEVPTTGD